MTRHALSAALLLLLGPLAACETDILESLDVCVVDLTVTPDIARPGDTIVLSGGPFSTTWDTTARIGGEVADVVDVDRTSCVPCDACRSDNDCTSCDACTDCEALCASCEETTSIVVPALPSGRWPIVIFNRHGGSDTAWLAVIGDDTDAPDTDTDTDGLDTDTDVDTDTDGLDTDTDGPDTDTDAGL
ncbi:MAG: hypothetical protein H6733_12285 [Alphaproteobacteria bacterium]|nr:hypothetical protein [Alphaproteobacteria bacterium]